MTELVSIHTKRQMVPNEQESILLRYSKELLHVFVADACIAFFRTWSPLMTDNMYQLLEQEPLLR